MSDECMPEEAVTNFGKQVPMKRPGQPAELADPLDMTLNQVAITVRDWPARSPCRGAG